MIVAGASLVLIRHAGSATPMWDQWDAIAAGTLVPYREGTLTVWSLLGHHNEHRLALTRALSLGLFIVNDGWNPLLEMVANAAIHALGCGLALAVLARALDRSCVVALAAFAAIMFGAPLAAANILGAFHTQFYVLILCGVVSMGLFARSPAWSARWWIASAIATASYFVAGASGVLILAAAGALALLQMVSGARRGRAEGAGILLHAAVVAVLVLDVPRMEQNLYLKAASVGQFVAGLGMAAAWPLAAQTWPPVAKWLAALALYAPALLMCWQLVRARAGLGDARWHCIALAALVGTQLSALAYGRGLFPIASRYLDMMVLGLVVNFACLLSLAIASRQRLGVRPAFAAASVWLVIVLASAGLRAGHEVVREIATTYEATSVSTANLRAYLRTGDDTYVNKPVNEIAYPDAQILRSHLSSPGLRDVLPRELFDPSPNEARRDEGLPGLQRATRTFTHIALGDLQVLLPVGIAVLFIAGWGARDPAPS